jgi:cell division protein FtsB
MAARAHAGTRVAPRRRPAARRRPAPRRGGSRVHWDRLGRVALTLVLGAILISYLNPLIGFVQTYRGSSVAKAHLHQLVVENKILHRRVQSTDDPAVLERQARRQGMIAPGERAYVVHGLNR